MAKLVDRVVETTQTTGTGTLDLGGAQTGYRAFSDELASGDTVFYCIEDDPSSPTVYEYGIGTWTSGSPATLSRDTVLGSSNGGSKISLQSGTTYTVTGTLTKRALKPPTLSKSAGYTVTAADHDTFIDCTAALTLALTAAATLGDGFRFDVRNSSSGNVTVDPNGVETIDGGSTLLLSPGQACRVECNGSAFKTVGRTDVSGLDADSSPDTAADYALVYDASAGRLRKVLLNLIGQTYAEGSWTPTVAGGSTPGAQTYSTQVGRYVRHGNLVTCWFSLVMTAKDGTTAGAFTVAGLPFASSSISGLKFAGAVGQFGNIDLTAGYAGVGLSLTAGSQAITVVQGGDNVAASGLTASAISATTEIHGSISYRIN